MNFGKESRGKGCLFVGIPDFMGRFSPDYSILTEINPDGIVKDDDFLQKGDIIFVRSNGNKALVGRSLFIDKDVKALFSGFCIRARITSEEFDKLFCAYFTKTATFKSQISSSSGTNINNLNQDILSQVKVPFLKKKEQQKIAAALSALDTKIDCNNRINAELEAMAKTLYDYWFVQFDFPDGNGRPYKSSGGQMVYNPTLKREIPAEWKDSNILAVADLLGGGTPTKKKPEYWNGSIPFFTPTDTDGTIFRFATADYISKEGLRKSSTKLFGKNTVIITARGSVGKLVLAGVDMAMNQSCYALRAKHGISHTYLFFLAKELIHHLEVKSSGSVFDSIVSNDVELTSLAIPDTTVVEKFATIAEPAFKQLANNTKENQLLAQLRDWLLPMLMNGQVTVK
jgi:type I restriction enzyme S subunit